MKKLIMAFSAMALLTVAAKAQAVSLDWQGNRCVVVDRTFKVCKPGKNWDTQKTGDDHRPVKWEYHRRDVNPVISLNYDWTASGKTAHDYAKVVKSDLASRGVKFHSTKNTVINGRNVTIIEASNPGKDLRYLIGVWRNKAKGFYLMGSSNPAQFDRFRPDFQQAINSVEIVNEGR